MSRKSCCARLLLLCSQDPFPQSDANSTLLFPQVDPEHARLPPRTHTSEPRRLPRRLERSFPTGCPPDGRYPCSATPSPTEHPYGPGSRGAHATLAVGQPTASGAVRTKSRAPSRAPSELGRRHSQLGQSAAAASPVSLPSRLTRASCVRAMMSTPHPVEVMLLPPFALQKVQIQLQVPLSQGARGMQLDILRV